MTNPRPSGEDPIERGAAEERSGAPLTQTEEETSRPASERDWEGEGRPDAGTADTGPAGTG